MNGPQWQSDEAFLYILAEDGRTPVPIDLATEFPRWSAWMHAHRDGGRTVAFDAVGRGYVSTVFLGQMLGFPDSRAGCFETMISLPGGDSFVRARTWDDAERNHRAALAEAVAALAGGRDDEIPPIAATDDRGDQGGAPGWRGT